MFGIEVLNDQAQPEPAKLTSKETTPLEPITIWLYALPKKQKSNGNEITLLHTSSIFWNIDDPVLKEYGGLYETEETV